jgi:hypothetical protein
MPSKKKLHFYAFGNYNFNLLPSLQIRSLFGHKGFIPSKEKQCQERENKKLSLEKSS